MPGLNTKLVSSPEVDNSDNDVLVYSNPNLKKSNAVGFFTKLFNKRLLSTAETPEEDEIMVEIDVEEEKKPSRYEQKSSEPVEKAAEKVERKSDVLIVGDLHGNYEAYMESLQRLGATDETGNWTGGDKKLILLGDIVSDRHPNGLKILEDLRILQKQAAKSGGEIDIIAGNHEDFAWIFLTASDSDPILTTCLNNEQGEGLVEFISEFSSNPALKECRTLEEIDDVMEETKHIGRYIREKMNQSPEGKVVLEQIASFKLIEIIDDTLFLHTELTPLIIETLGKYGKTPRESIDKINDIYRKGLKSTLFTEEQPSEDFNSIRKIFLDTNNRNYQTKQGELKWLHENGINRVIHGHTDLYKRHGKNIFPTYDDIDMVSLDNSAGKNFEIKPGDTLSVGIIEKEKGKLTTSLEVPEEHSPIR